MDVQREKKSSNAKIIEFDVSSEDDVKYIITHDINESEKVRYYGFKKHMQEDSDGIIKPKYQKLQKFILYESGKTYSRKKCDCQTITDRHAKSLFEITTSASENWRLKLYYLLTAIEHGFYVQDCYLCKHCYYSNEKEGSECKVKNEIIGTGADAVKCQFYEFDASVGDRVKPLYVPLDVWKRPTIQTHNPSFESF